MESKKAREYLDGLKPLRIYGVGEIDSAIGRVDAKIAVVMAEQELSEALIPEEKAVEAFKMACPFSFCGMCEWVLSESDRRCGIESQEPCVDTCTTIEHFKQFLAALKSK